MKSILNSMSLYFETVPDWLRRKKWLVWLFFIAFTVFVAFGIKQTEFDMTLEGWFADDDPIKVALDKFKDEFGSDDGVFIVYKPKDGNVFSANSLQVVKGIREDLLNFRLRLKEGENSKLEHIVRINTLVNAPVLKAEEDSLISSHLVGNTIPTSQEDLDNIQKTAKSQKTFPLLYFSKDQKYGGIFIETDFGTIPMDFVSSSGEIANEDSEFGEELAMDDITMEVDEGIPAERIRFKPTDMNDYLGLMEEINAVLNKAEYVDHLEYYPVGNAPMMEYGMEIMEEMGPMTIGMLFIMVILLWFLFRSLSAVVWPVSIVVLSTIWTVGLAGWLGITITTMLMLTVMLILAVGTADAIHILSGYLFFRKKGQDHQNSLRMAFRKSALACLLTSVTTMVGMLALTFTPIAHIKVFGFMSAAGVGLAFIFTIYLLPVMLDLWSPVKEKELSQNRFGAAVDRLFPRFYSMLQKITAAISSFSSATAKYIPDFSRYIHKMLNRVLPLVQRSPFGFAVFFLVIFGVCIYGATRVRVDSNMIEQFKEGTKIRDTYEIVDREMMGTQNMEIYLDMGAEYAFQDPFVLNIMDDLQQKIEKKYSTLVVRTSSLVDIVKDSYQTLSEGREEMYIIPANQNVLSQTLFLFNNANPDDRRKLVSDDYSKSHISVQLFNTGSYEYIKAFDFMRRDIDEAVTMLKQEYPDTEVTITGGLALIMELSDYITWSQLKSLGLAIFVISIILIFIFGSFRAGLISIIPNLIPATLTFGLLGLLGIALDMDTMIMAPVIIGIAVDDTIHFITHYRGEVLIDGDINRALKDTISEVGQAITFTTLILGFGFSIMAFSTHMGTSNMGRFGTTAIFVALMCDLFLLPAMILIFKPKFQRKRAKQSSVLTN
ncbi:MMPL family transporter [bacterium]|nr:MMPL family transporter [bacterium]